MTELDKILTAVNTFYQNSFNQLVIVVVGLVAFIGTLIPFMLAFFQTRTIKREYEAARGDLRNQVHEATETLRKDLLAVFENESKKIEANLKDKLVWLEEALDRSNASSKGAAHHLQANQLLVEKDYVGAATSAAYAVAGYAKGRDELNLNRIKVVLERALPYIKLSEITNNTEFDHAFQCFFDEVSKINENDRYTDLIQMTSSAIATIRHGPT